MTKIAIQPNASGTGVFTLTAPDSNTNRTLTLPDAAGEVLTDQSDLGAANLTGDVAAARITTALNASGSAPIFACRAWVTFDGTTTPPTIGASGNVSSVVRNATGDFTVNFSGPMQDANFSPVTTWQGEGTGIGALARFISSDAGSYRFLCAQTNGAAVNPPRAHVAVFR